MNVIKTLFFMCLCYCYMPANAQVPSANFSANVLAGCSPQLIQYTDQSTNAPTSWVWDLGNGTTSFIKNPSVIYIAPGTYTVTLTATNASGAGTIVKTSYITIYPTPVAQFIGSPLFGCAPLNVAFTDQTTSVAGAISTQWEWNFGDGTSSTAQNPAHTYTTPGNYSVVLKTTNSQGCSNVIAKPQYITVGAATNAGLNFAINPYCGLPVAVSFSNVSTGAGALTYSWDFGDGTTGSTASPTHNYTAFGNYTARLTVTSELGCTQTVTKVVNIVPVAGSFTGAASACVGKPVTFTSTSTPTPASYTWAMGDGTTFNTANVTHAYTTAGTYTVKLISNFGSCADTTSSIIVVNPAPTVAFSAPVTTSCTAPLAVNFQNTSTGGISYQWIFGDGTTSTAPAPSHTYTSLGSYTVTLIVTNASGCSDTLIKPSYINLQPLDVTVLNAAVSSCLPYTMTPTFSGIPAANIGSILWDFGDGTTSNLAAPSHIYTTQGTYTITLTIVTNNGCTVVKTSQSKFGTKLPANFSALPNPVCSAYPVQFTSVMPTAPSFTFNWAFGDGNSNSTDVNPVHTYAGIGSYTVTLTITNNGCDTNIIKPDYINVLPPTAYFRHVIDCSNRMAVNFVDSSIQAIGYHWEFGDGSSSTLQNPPPHIYAAGVYYPTLTVTHNECSHTKFDTIYIGKGPIELTASQPATCKKAPVTFTASHANPFMVKSYFWQMGDGAQYTTTTPQLTYAYADTGRYTVMVISTDINGCKDSVTKTQFIRVYGPSAKFSASPLGGCSNLPVHFTDNSTTDGVHALTNWSWIYGDGNSQNLTGTGNVTHLYLLQGSYDVTMIVKDNMGCTDTSFKPVYIVISDVVAQFTADTASCISKDVHFTNQTSSNAVAYLWSFGDGATSTTANPTHAYNNNGLYTVKLLVTGPSGCLDSISKTSAVKIDKPTAHIGMQTHEVACPPANVPFQNLSTFTTSVQWAFGDGNSSVIDDPSNNYLTPGLYTIKLVATSPGGCTDTTTEVLRVKGPFGTFSYAPLVGCEPLTVNFNAVTLGATKFIWDYADGNTQTTTAASSSHTYTVFANYQPRMILEDADGCQVPINGADLIHVEGSKPVFTADKLLNCDTATVHFTNTSTSNTAGSLSYQWNFGDGVVSNAQNPSHHYTAPGLYPVSLTVTTSTLGCAKTLVLPSYIKIVSSPKPTIILADTAQCKPGIFTFSSQLAADTSAIVSYQWSFGNNAFYSGLTPPEQVYSNTGVQANHITVTNSSGCVGVDYQNVLIDTLPLVDATNDFTICRDKGAPLVAAHANNYQWSPATGLSCTNCATPFANAPIEQKYVVIGTDNNGCVGKDSVTVKVLQKYFVNHTPNLDTLCAGKSVQLTATGNAQHFNWTPTTGLSNPNNPVTIATPNISTTYRLVASDTLGCFNDTAYVPIVVYQIPKLTMPVAVNTTVGTHITLTPTVSADVTKYLWTPGIDLTCLTCPAPSFSATQDRRYALTVTNDGGCRTTGTVDVYVSCLESSIFIPNTFSPNNDGANDIFYVRGSGSFQVRAFRIFDRWGQLVFEKRNVTANDPQAGWDGTFKGKKLDADAFVYQADVICRNGQLFTFKGSVSLIR